MDAVTQWEILECVQRISEQYLLPVLEAMLHQFPFRVLGLFHADNGSEYVNHKVAALLEKLLVEFTRWRGADPNKRSATRSLHSVCTAFATLPTDYIRIAVFLHAVCSRVGNLRTTLHWLCKHFASNASHQTAENLVVEHKRMSNADSGLWMELVLVSRGYPVGQDRNFVRHLSDGHFNTLTGPASVRPVAWVAPR